MPLFFILVPGGLLLGLLIGLGLLIANRKTRTAGLMTLGCLAVVPFAGWFSFQSNVSQIRRELGEGVVVADPDSPTQNSPVDNPLSYVPIEPHVSWGVLLLPVTIVGALAAAAWRCFGRGRNTGGVIVSALAAVVLLAFGLRYWEMQRVNSQPRAASIAVASQPASTAAEAFDKLTKPHIQLEPPLGADPPAGADPPPGAEPAIGAKPNATTDPPSWVTNLPRKSGGHAYKHLISNPFGPNSHIVDEQRTQIFTEAIEHIRRNLASDAPHPRLGAAGAGKYRDLNKNHNFETPAYFGIKHAELHSRLVEDEYYATVPNHEIIVGGVRYPKRVLHTLMHISPEDSEWLLTAWQKRNDRSNKNERLAVLLTVCAVVLGLIASLYGLLRVDGATSGRHAKRLLIGASVVILGLLVTWVFAWSQMHDDSWTYYTPYS